MTVRRSDGQTDRGTGGQAVGRAVDRREFLSSLAVSMLALPQQEADRLRDPATAGRSRLPVGAVDNSEVIKGVERQLKCTCGCNLDIFTCRTTDFTCSYSPALHQEVVSLYESGRQPQEIVTAFVGKYGEQILMAPPPKGFNLAGYLLPGIAVLGVGTILALVLLRRQRAIEVSKARQAGDAAPPPSSSNPSTQELEQLERALSDVAD